MDLHDSHIHLRHVGIKSVAMSAISLHHIGIDRGRETPEPEPGEYDYLLAEDGSPILDESGSNILYK